MKLTIEVIEDDFIGSQLEAVKRYIQLNGYKETGKETGEKVFTPSRAHHVMLNKTKTGNYSIKVWRGV